MHAIRSAARQSAWQYYDGSSRNYNPFARTSRGTWKQTSDEEDLHHIHTADSVPSSAEAERLDNGRKEYSHPPRAGTAPSQSAIDDEKPAHAHFSPTAEDNDASAMSSGVNGAAVTDPEKTSQVPVDQRGPQADGQATPSNAPRRRKFAFMDKLNPKHKNEDEDITRSDTGGSKKKRRKHIGFMPQLKATLFGSWINLLLVCVPIGFAINYTHVNGVATFVVNFVAIVPLAAMLSYATEELAMYTGETIGGLLNASFGNATELIVGVIALAQGKILIVQTSLVGSMLSNLLLVLGMCFFFGGINRVKQHFNITVAQTASSLLALSIGSLIIPTAFFRFGSQVSNGSGGTSTTETNNGIGPISRGTAVILLLVYACYLFFQLKTHTDMYNEPSQKVEKRKSHHKEKGDSLLEMAKIGAAQTVPASQVLRQNQPVVKKPREEGDDDDDEGETPSLTIVGALVTLLISTVLIAFCSEFMVTGISAITGNGGVSEEFVGLILIPIVGNAAEHATAVTVACKDKMDLAIGVAVGSSMQIALLILPLMVIIGWCGVAPDMTLNFDGFQVTVLFIAVLLVNYLIQDGESHWLEGVLLQATYVIIAVSAFFYPTDPTQDIAG